MKYVHLSSVAYHEDFLQCVEVCYLLLLLER